MNLVLRNCYVKLVVYVLSASIGATGILAETIQGDRTTVSGRSSIVEPLPARGQPPLVPQQDWPSPVNDGERRLFTLVDVLEYRPRTGGDGRNSDYRWDIEGWYGGDYNRLWFKSEGQQDTAFKADYDVDFQLLYGRFIGKHYDIQVGGRMETQSFR